MEDQDELFIFIGKATSMKMKHSIKLSKKNRRSALGLVLVICVLFLQQASATALYLCDNSSSSSGKKLCHCRQHATSSTSRNGSMKMGEVKNSHCKSASKAPSQKPGIGSFKRAATTIDKGQIKDPLSTSQACCQIGKSEAGMPDSIISIPNLDVVDDPAVEIDPCNCSPPLSHSVISHVRSRTVYLLVSSFLI